MRFLADWISKILNPLLFAALSIIVVVSQADLSLERQAYWFFLAVVAIAIPSSFLYFQYKKGNIKEFWSPDVKERRESVLLWAASAGLFVCLAFFFEAPRLILALSIVFLVLSIVNLLAGSSLKLSVHGEAITVFVLVSMLTLSVLYIFLAVLIPIVTWARVRLKAHTVSEVTFGTLAAVLAVYFVFNYFGLVTF